jgi:hypothetical protein
MTPKTTKSSDKPANRAQIERIISERYGLARLRGPWGLSVYVHAFSVFYDSHNRFAKVLNGFPVVPVNQTGIIRKTFDAV